MARRLVIPLALLTLLGGTAAVSASPLATPAGCSNGSVRIAARDLIDPQADVAELGTVAGFRTALVLEPLIYPGVRHRLIQAGDLWCDATGFNAAWRAAGRPADALAMARAFASIAPAPYFDGVTTTKATEVVSGLFSLETHALTNGITAQWVIATDASGVRSAVWTAKEFAVRPFVGEWEGLTALPGLRRSYAQGLDGAIDLQQPLIPVSDDPPELVTEGKTADDFIIRVQYGNTEFSPNIGEDTGVHPVDYLRFVRKVSLENYQDFYNWGLRKGWSSNVGIIHVDSSTAATCLACVFIREDFQIHVSTAVVQALFALGFEYPDDKLAFANVIGHEMTHDWQNAYYKPQQNSASSEVSFAEGVARFQESIHPYSEVSHQPGSLIYNTGRELAGVSVASEANSCNGWDRANRDSAFAAGPFTNHTYDACYFFLTWYQNHGTSGIVDLFTAYFDHAKASGVTEVIGALKQSTGDTFLEDLAFFAQASLTGHGYRWATPGTTEPVRDWGTWLERWEPGPLALDATASKTIRNGGISAYQITDGGYATLTSTKPETALVVVRGTETSASHAVIPSGEFVPPPAEGEKVWLLAIYPMVGSAGATVGLSSAPPAA